MEQLTELDNTFVQAETSRTPMHITPVMFYDQSAVQGGKLRFKEILTVFERNLHKSAVFRRKLAGGALGFDTPYWIEDPDFDLEFHVRHIALPRPGDWRQLCILLARLHARGLDMRRPLWEAYVIEGLNEVEGLPPNSFAITLKVHHAAIDGVSAAEILSAIHSPTDEREPPLVEDNWRGEAAPSALQVWGRAYWNNVSRPLKLIETVGELLPSMVRAGSSEENDREGPPDFVRTRFNARVSSYRVTDILFLDLSEVKAIKNRVDGVTVNDVIVSVIGGGMRKYLESKGELPEPSLVCGAPINVRQDRSSDSRGNQVGMMTIRMATDIADPVDRLKAVNRYARESKQYSSAVSANAIMDISRGLWPQFIKAGIRAVTLAALASDMGMPINTVISNVPGPQIPLYLGGARLHLLTGMGPLLDMFGLFHGVVSANGKLSINFVSCRELMPDPDFYRDCLQEAWEELEAATSVKANRRKRRNGKRRAE